VTIGDTKQTRATLVTVGATAATNVVMVNATTITVDDIRPAPNRRTAAAFNNADEDAAEPSLRLRARPLSPIRHQYFQHCHNLTGSSRRAARWMGFKRPTPAASTREDFHHWLS
jgi:hypothetical protein